MTRPLLLDVYCGAGGAAMGYWRAGFDVVGVDINPQPDYPFTFIQADAIAYLHHVVNHASTRYAAVHTSPPCQSSTALTKGTNQGNGKVYPSLIEPTRELLSQLDIPWIIENVQGAKVRRDLTLCGEMFGLDVIRHRYFECSFPVEQLEHTKHRGRVAGMRHGAWYQGPYFAVYGEGGGKGTVEQWQQAMGIDWTDNRKSIAEAIPPSYSEYIGGQLIRALKVAA